MFYVKSLYVVSEICIKSLKIPMVWFVVFNATFNNISVISWRSDFFVKETRVSGENHRPVDGVRTHNFSGERY